MEEKHEVLQVLRSPSRHVKKLRITKTHNIKTADNRSSCNSAINTYKWVTHSIDDLGTPMVYD
jgi:hypothetical protein